MLLLRGRPTARRPTPTTAACWAAAMMALALRGLGACRAFQFSALQPASRSRPAANALMLLSSSSNSNGHGNKRHRAASDAVPTTLTRAYYTSGSVASVARSNVLLAASTTTDAETADTSASSNDSSNSSGSASLLGIDWVRGCVSKVLNDAFDPAEVARAAARSKLEPKKKKKKKKKKQEDDDAAKQDEPPPMSEEEKEAILAAAAAAAQPFTDLDAAVTAATKSEFGDYQCNAAMALAKNVGLAPRDCAAQIVDGLRPLISHCMEEPEIAGPGFINLKFREEYLARAVREMAAEAGPGGRLAVPPVA